MPNVLPQLRHMGSAISELGLQHTLSQKLLSAGMNQNTVEIMREIQAARSDDRRSHHASRGRQRPSASVVSVDAQDISMLEEIRQGVHDAHVYLQETDRGQRNRRRSSLAARTKTPSRVSRQRRRSAGDHVSVETMSMLEDVARQTTLQGLAQWQREHQQAKQAVLIAVAVVASSLPTAFSFSPRHTLGPTPSPTAVEDTSGAQAQMGIMLLLLVLSIVLYSLYEYCKMVKSARKNVELATFALERRERKMGSRISAVRFASKLRAKAKARKIRESQPAKPQAKLKPVMEDQGSDERSDSRARLAAWRTEHIAYLDAELDAIDNLNVRLGHSAPKLSKNARKEQLRADFEKAQHARPSLTRRVSTGSQRRRSSTRRRRGSVPSATGLAAAAAAEVVEAAPPPPSEATPLEGNTRAAGSALRSKPKKGRSTPKQDYRRESRKRLLSMMEIAQLREQQGLEGVGGNDGDGLARKGTKLSLVSEGLDVRKHKGKKKKRRKTHNILHRADSSTVVISRGANDQKARERRRQKRREQKERRERRSSRTHRNKGKHRRHRGKPQRLEGITQEAFDLL